MKFLSLLAALLLEQAWPLRPGNPVHAGFARYVGMLEAQLNGGQYRQGVMAWALAVLPPAVAASAVYILLHSMSAILGWLWNLALLYLTLGFRQFSHAYTGIRKSLQEGDLGAAREQLGRWRGESTAEFTTTEVSRVTIEQALLASHRHVFGTLFWFLVLGAAGAVAYRAAAMVAGTWGARAASERSEFERFAVGVFDVMDWLPVRLTALSFAVVGDFEDAIYCWRTQAQAWGARSHGVLLASGAGALGVRLGEALHQHGSLHYRPELGTGDEADAAFMDSATGLIWRALVLWMLLILLVSFAHALG